MAIGDTVQAGLMRVDSSPILLAGQAQAQANQAFGNAVGGVVEKFYQKKKDKQERDEREQAYLKMGLTSEEAKAASRDKDLANQFINKMNADRNFNLQMLQLKNNEALNAARIASLGDESIGRERLLKEAEELKEKTTGFEKYLSKQPQVIDPTGPGRFDVLRNLREGKGVTPPARMIPGASPAEEMLMSPEAKSFARRAVEGGQPMSLVMPMAQKIDSQIAAQQLAEKNAAPSLKDILEIQGKTLDMDIKTKEFQQKQDAISFKPERNYLDLGEVRFGISGKYANETEVAKIKSEVLPNYSNMNAITDQLIKMGEDIEGDFFVSPSDKVLAEALASSLQGLIRVDILGPGTVNNDERVILKGIIENPVEYFNVKRNRRDKINSLKGLRKKAFNKLRTRFNGLGLDVSEFEQGGNASGTNKSSNMQNQTDSGLSFEEISLDDL
jgi:hypothetical protein